MIGKKPSPVFAPSARLLREFKRARTLNRNVQRSSLYSPRLHRLAAQAAAHVRALDASERAAFKESNA